MRTVNVNVNGSFVYLSGKNAGVMGEGNATTFILNFDESWDVYSKRLIWRDAQGGNPVSILLFGSGPYITSIPSEPLTIPGWCSFTVEGFYESTPNQVAFTVSEKMYVARSDTYHQPTDPTPSEVMQLMEMYRNLHLIPGPQGPEGPMGPRGLQGHPMTIKGIYDTLQDLEAAVPVGEPGDVYAVRHILEYNIYAWDDLTQGWLDMGLLQLHVELVGLQASLCYGEAGYYEVFLDRFDYRQGEMFIIIPEQTMVPVDGNTPIMLSVNEGTPFPLMIPGGRQMSIPAGPPFAVIYKGTGVDTGVFIYAFPTPMSTPRVEVMNRAPNEYDDASKGFMVGDIWVNSTWGEVYFCTDATANIATWRFSGEGGSPAGPAPIVGASTFNGYATGRVITHNLGHQDYDVRIMPTADPAGNLGEVWITKANSTVAIKCSGSATTAFEYVITPRDSGQPM